MIIIKLSDEMWINADKIRGAVLSDNTIEFLLPGGDGDDCFRKEYDSEEEAAEAYKKLFIDLASTPGVEGAVLQ